MMRLRRRSLAGVLGLSKLVCLWNDDGISAAGHVAGWIADDTPARFEAYGWHVVRDVDGHDPDELGLQFSAMSDGLAIQVLLNDTTMTPHRMYDICLDWAQMLIGVDLN